MNRGALLPSVYLIDQVLGDPEWFPHPVRLMGLAITRGEALLRRHDQTFRDEFIAGATLTSVLVTATYSLTEMMLQQAYRRSRITGHVLEGVLGWTCLAARNLQQEAEAVIRALESGDIELARRRLARIVGRDTHHLDEHEISRAVIETVAESASDGVIAPLFYMAIGGVPLAMAYKAVNTLDSMIGHADARYFYFGKAGARLDDVANYLPARITAAAIVVSAAVATAADPKAAWRIWRRDGSKHKSPNAGQPESAMSGALRVRLGGDNTYDGEQVAAEVIGREFTAPQLKHARAAIRIVSVMTLLSLGVGMIFCALARPNKAR